MDGISPSEAIAANRILWDAWTRAHRESAFYDVPGFLAGRDPLSRIETEELGDVTGKRFLHLQFVPGGLSHLQENHPFLMMLGDDGERIRWPYPFPGYLERRPEGDYGWPGGREDLPLTFSVGALRPSG